MTDKGLVALIIATAILITGHTVDHIARGDLLWPLALESVPFIAVTLALYSIIGVGLYVYLAGKVGARFWAIIAVFGVAFGWLAHFSPVTDQPLQHIVRSYESVAIGWLAGGCLIALMIVLIIAALRAGYLWMRALR